MWDLTVPGNNDHDFYVLAGDGGTAYGVDRDGVTAVLVHNCNENIPDVALGLQKNGLLDWAKKMGYRHFVNYANADGEIVGYSYQEALGRVSDVAYDHPETTIHVRLDGFKVNGIEVGAEGGPTPWEAFDAFAKAGRGTEWITTEREMGILSRAWADEDASLPGRLKFYLNGSDITDEVVANSIYLNGGGSLP